MTFEALRLREAKARDRLELVQVETYATKVRKWSRTDSARWLNDRSERVLAWLRRHRAAEAHSRQMGYWLKAHDPDLFGRAHGVLAGLPEEGRDRLMVEEVFR